LRERRGTGHSHGSITDIKCDRLKEENRGNGFRTKGNVEDRRVTGQLQDGDAGVHKIKIGPNGKKEVRKWWWVCGGELKTLGEIWDGGVQGKSPHDWSGARVRGVVRSTRTLQRGSKRTSGKVL